MNNVEKTYKDFNIGDDVFCIGIDDTDVDFWDQHFTVGKKYTIFDVDFHFPDKICVLTDEGKINMFINIKYFSNSLNQIRDKKLKRILGKYEGQ